MKMTYVKLVPKFQITMVRTFGRERSVTPSAQVISQSSRPKRSAPRNVLLKVTTGILWQRDASVHVQQTRLAEYLRVARFVKHAEKLQLQTRKQPTITTLTRMEVSAWQSAKQEYIHTSKMTNANLLALPAFIESMGIIRFASTHAELTNLLQ